MGLRDELPALGRDAPPTSAALEDPTLLQEVQDDMAWREVEAHLQRMKRHDEIRRNSAMQRRRLFQGQGLDLGLATLDDAFKDERVREIHKAFTPYARVNYMRRKTRERSRLYAKAPHSRRVADESGNENYQKLQKLTRHNQAMKFADETTDYQNDTFWLFRVRDTPRGREPRTDIMGPESFFLIVDPSDQTKLLAVGVDRTPMAKPGDKQASKPHWIVWSDEESFELNATWNIIRDSIKPNPFGRIPGVLVNNGYRAQTLLDPFTGEEAVSTHLSLWLQQTLLLKGIASKTKQAVFTGETGNSPANQAQDDTTDLVLAEGVGVTTVERGIDINQITAAQDHTEERAAAGEGIPPQVLRHAGATSGYEMDLRRIPLEEIREDRVDIFREAERDYAEVQSVVLAHDLPALNFGLDGWHLDFAEIKRPEQESQKWANRQTKRKMGHSDPVVEAMEDNPDFDEEQAKEWVGDRMQNQAVFEAARATRNMSGDPLAGDRTPEQNGAMGGRASQSDEDDSDDEQDPPLN